MLIFLILNYGIIHFCLRDVSVPLFVCLSGALLITKKDSFIVFIKKRFNKVIIPYIFWVVIFIILELFIYKIKNPWDLILNTISIPPTGIGVFFLVCTNDNGSVYNNFYFK